MSWWYEHHKYPSEKNGLIQCTRWFGRWEVTAGGCGQTTPYVRALWKKALRRIPERRSIKQVLSLGLGAGGQLPLLRRRFPGAFITVIEWDPVMIHLARTLRIYTPDERISIKEGDARELVPTLAQTYDLITVDLFRGSDPSPVLVDASFIWALASKLAPRGYLLLNVYQTNAVLPFFDHALSRQATWRYWYNTVALYRPRGCGMVGDPLPDGYTTVKQSPSYVRGDCDPRTRAYLVGSEERWGARWWHGPLCFEGYETDVEPQIEPGPRRMVIWQPLTRLDKPTGWHRSFIQMNFRRTGFAEIKNPERYWESWTPHAQRHRRRWLREQAYEIEEAAEDAFVVAYRDATRVPRYLRGDFIKMVRRRRAFHGADTHLFVVRERKTGRVMAGLAVVDTMDASHSTHLVSFVHPDAISTSASTGLIDHWFQHCIRQGIRFLNFGVFWTFGDPWSWRGFSRFKSQFGIHYIHRPNPLVRFVGASQPRD